jgi:hypothetical protein
MIVERIRNLPFDQKAMALLRKDLPLKEAARETNMDKIQLHQKVS